MAPKWTDLQQMSDDDLIAAHDHLAGSTQVGVNYYRDEISRRAFERASAAAHELATAALEEARVSRRLAKWNMVVAVVAVVVTVVTIVAQLVLG